MPQMNPYNWMILINVNMSILNMTFSSNMNILNKSMKMKKQLINSKKWKW